MEDQESRTIRISGELYRYLESLGGKNDTFDTIIKRCLNFRGSAPEDFLRKIDRVAADLDRLRQQMEGEEQAQARAREDAVRSRLGLARRRQE